MTTLLSVFGILLAIGAIVCIIQLQARVDSLEQRCARYEFVFDQLQRKLSTDEDFSQRLRQDSTESLIDLNIAEENGSGQPRTIEPTALPIEALLSSKLSPLLQEDNESSNQSVSSAPLRPFVTKLFTFNSAGERDLFDKFIHDVSVCGSVWSIF